MANELRVPILLLTDCDYRINFRTFQNREKGFFDTLQLCCSAVSVAL